MFLFSACVLLFLLPTLTDTADVRTTATSSSPCDHFDLTDCLQEQQPTTFSSSDAHPIESIPSFASPTRLTRLESANTVIQRVREELHKKRKRTEHRLKLHLQLPKAPSPKPSQSPLPPPIPTKHRLRKKSSPPPPINISLDAFLHPLHKLPPRPRKPPPPTVVNITHKPACPHVEPWSPTDPNASIVPDLRVPGTLALTQDSPFVHTSCDLRNIVGPLTHFPRIIIQGKQFDVLESPKDARTITLGDTYCGSSKEAENVQRLPINGGIDRTQDWVEVEECRVQVTNGEVEAWTDCDISTQHKTDGGVDNGECVRIDCNQYTLVEGGGTFNVADASIKYEEKRTCSTAFGTWSGNLKKQKGSVNEELPQHTLTVEVAGATKPDKYKITGSHENALDSADADPVGGIINNIEEEMMKSVEESNRLATSSSLALMLEVWSSSASTRKAMVFNNPFRGFHGNDQISMDDLKDTASSIKVHYTNVPLMDDSQLLEPIHLGLSQVRTTTQLLALLQSIVAGLSPVAIHRAVTASAYLDLGVPSDPSRPLLLGDMAAARVSIRGSTWMSLATKKCVESEVKQIKTRPRMVLLLQRVLLGMPCNSLRRSSGIDGQFTHRILLDRKWNWPSSTGDQGLPIYRLRRKPLPKEIKEVFTNDDPLPCNSMPLKSGDTTVPFICCDNLRGLKCLDNRILKVSLPIGMENQLQLLDGPMISNFGPLLHHCPIKIAEHGSGSLSECPLMDDDADNDIPELEIDGPNNSNKESGANKREQNKGVDFNGNKVPHPLPVQSAKLPRGKGNNYPRGDYPGGDPKEEEEEREKQRERDDAAQKGSGMNIENGGRTTEKNQKKTPTWGPVPVHVNGPRGGSDYLVDPNTGKTYNLDHGQIPADKLRTMRPKTYQARVENGWDADTAAGGGYAPG
jgi:hypothetical protein